jgi:aerobic-type carbon monoxide dehydrogenase small subunit (CoxS/CutS family)
LTPAGQWVRLGAAQRSDVEFSLDGEPASARIGDTLLTAILLIRRRLSKTRSADPHAGFCLMGACQECWITADDRPVRACSTLVAPGMRVDTRRHAARD